MSSFKKKLTGEFSSENDFSEKTQAVGEDKKPVYLTQKQAAELICKKPRWLERTRWAGGGPPFRYVGRSPVYEKSELLEWMASLPLLKHTSNSE